MRRKISLPIFGLSISTAFILLLTPATYAATAQPTPPANSGTGQALEIAPPIININGNPGQTIRLQINLRNVSKGPLIVQGQVNDFIAAGEDGTPKILLNNNDNEANPFSIRGWVGVLPELTMKPQQVQVLPVTIHIPDTASPGGHYGVIRFTATPPELKETGVSLSASLGSLVLVRVNGQAKEAMSIKEFSVNKNGKEATLFESAPVDFVVRAQNNGNVHEQPTGQITVTNMFGQRLATVNVNLPPRNVLPASIRKFTTPLDSSVIGNKKLFGKYTADLKLTYGSNKQTMNSSLSFWVIPYKLIGIVVIGLIAAFFILRFLVRRYNSHIIHKAQNGQQGRKK